MGHLRLPSVGGQQQARDGRSVPAVDTDAGAPHASHSTEFGVSESAACHDLTAQSKATDCHEWVTGQPASGSHRSAVGLSGGHRARPLQAVIQLILSFTMTFVIDTLACGSTT
jgi:hypothetical protein